MTSFLQQLDAIPSFSSPVHVIPSALFQQMRNDLKKKDEDLNQIKKDITKKDEELNQARTNGKKLEERIQNIQDQVVNESQKKTIELEDAIFQKEQTMQLQQQKLEEQAVVINEQKEQTNQIVTKEKDSLALQLKTYYETAMAKMKAENAEQLKSLTESHTRKVSELKEAIQKLQDLLPNRADKEGFLVKQGGSHKGWQKKMVRVEDKLCLLLQRSEESEASRWCN